MTSNLNIASSGTPGQRRYTQRSIFDTPALLPPLRHFCSLNAGAIDRPKNMPDGLQNRYPARG
jgi:hypothetical protein